MKQFFVFVLMLLCITACSKGPAEDKLSHQIQTKLNTDFEPGLFKITDLSRRGNYSYSDLGKSTKKLIVYFKAKLAFQKDHTLTDWDELSVGSLSYILGATPSGIIGVKPQGNKKKDILVVYGTVNYKKEAGNWIAIAPKLRTPKGKIAIDKKYVAEIDEADTQRAKVLEYKKSLKILNNIFGELDKDTNKKYIQVAEFELKKVMLKAQMVSARQEGLSTIATGSPLGNYYAIGKGLEELIGDGNQFKAFATTGSVENSHLVNEKQVSFAIVQSDMASMAYQGRDLFKDSIPMKNLRAVAALYPEALMVVTRKKDHINDFKELIGKKIDIGAKGSGHRADAIQLLRAYNLSRDDFAQIHETSFQKSIKLLGNKAVDAIFVTGAFPMNALNELNATQPIHILSLGQEIIEKMTKAYPVTQISIPVNTYKGQSEPIKTVGNTAMIITHKDVPKDSVKTLINTLVDKSSKLAKRSVQANFITRRNMDREITIPLHPAAFEFYKNK